MTKVAFVKIQTWQCLQYMPSFSHFQYIPEHFNQPRLRTIRSSNKSLKKAFIELLVCCLHGLNIKTSRGWSLWDICVSRALTDVTSTCKVFLHIAYHVGAKRVIEKNNPLVGLYFPSVKQSSQTLPFSKNSLVNTNPIFPPKIQPRGRAYLTNKF